MQSKRGWCIALALIIPLMLFGMLAAATRLGLNASKPSLTITPDLPPLVATARAKVPMGSTREAAVNALSDAWYHGTCSNGPDVVWDMFLYGSHDPNDVQAVFVQSHVEQGHTAVFFVGMVEPYQLLLYKNCLPSDFTPSK